MSRRDFCVREVAEKDLPALVDIENRVWSALESLPISHEILKKWLEERSPFFLVAETDGQIVGYYFGQFNDFDFDKLNKYTNLDIFTGKGYINIPHDPRGDSLYGITITSIAPGAGSALYHEVLTLWKKLKKRYYFGYCRLSGFKAYLEGLNLDEQRIAETVLDKTALWYAHTCMKMVGGKIWSQCDPQLDLALPAPPPDQILSFHSKCCGGKFGLVCVLPCFASCPESRGYAAFLVYESEEV